MRTQADWVLELDRKEKSHGHRKRQIDGRVENDFEDPSVYDWNETVRRDEWSDSAVVMKTLNGITEEDKEGLGWTSRNLLRWPDSLRVNRAGNHYDVSRGINDDNIVGTGIVQGPEIGPVELGVVRRGIVRYLATDFLH